MTTIKDSQRMKNSELTTALKAKATALLRLGAPIHTAHPFELEGVRYIGRVEWHHNEAKGKHVGISLYYADEPITLSAPRARVSAAVAVGDMPGVAFVQARNYRAASRGDVRNLVIHVAQCSEVVRAAENLASWAAGPDAPHASWHFAIDADSVTQSVRERDVAWHAPPLNPISIGLELAGRSEQSAEQWADDYSAAVLSRSAELAASICTRWAIPIRRLSVEQLTIGTRGIVGHSDVSAAFSKSSHWDPGPGFPWSLWIELVRDAQRRQLAVRSALPELRRGARGPHVREWQAYVGATLDGAFGPETEKATVLWQKQHGLTPTGMVDAAAWALAARLARDRV